MRWVVVLAMVAGCGRFGFDPRVDADPPTGDGAHDAATDAAADAMVGSDAMMGAFAIMQSTTASTGTGPQTVMLTNPTTSGTVLVATFALNSLGALTVPSGWTMPASGSTNGACGSAILIETSGSAGRQSLMFTLPAGAPSSVQVTEWTGVDLANAVDQVGMGGGNSSTLSLTISTSGATTVAGDLAIASFCEDVQNPTFTPGAGWTGLGQVAVSSALPSLFSEYQSGVPAATITATATGSVAAKYAPTIVTLHAM